MNHVLDRFDLEPGYCGDCPICGAGLYDDQECSKAAGEPVHKSCKETLDEEMMDWGQE